MEAAVTSIHKNPPLGRLKKACAADAIEWSYEVAAGRLVEISSTHASASLSWAFRLVKEVQRLHEPVAWIQNPQRTFYPPDVAELGVQLEHLVVVHLATPRAMSKAADQLLRSGGFGLVVVDLEHVRNPYPLSDAMQSRLAMLCKKQQATLLVLTRKAEAQPSMGSLVSLRLHSDRKRHGPMHFDVCIEALKDKRTTPGWLNRVLCVAPAGCP